MSTNSLYFGDNLEILRNEIKSDSVDLIYLDPPFNSKVAYNRLFKSRDGRIPQAQRTAFEDTWIWGDQAEREFAELVRQPNTDVSEMMQALRRFLGENDVMAYLTMMANRLLELQRVLKPTGSLYLHCDPTASHYLKLVLDGVFGKENFRNEIVWQRTSAHNDPRRYGRIHDVLFFYAKSSSYTWNQQYDPPDEQYFKAHDFEEDEEGRLFRKRDLTAPAHGTQSGQYEWHGLHPPRGRMWSYTRENMDRLEKEGRIAYTRTGMPRLKIYEKDLKGVPYQDLWARTELWLNSAAAERLGYQTQKPLALLERIIEISSNEDDIVLDPFCGCGTAIHAAEKLKRKWVGIDITNLAISLVEDRLRGAFPGITFDVHGVPKDLDSARDLAQRDKYEFEWWACSLVNAQPYKEKKKGADGGIDGVIYFQDDKTMPKKVIVSVKAGEHVSVPMIRDLGHVINREKASLGLFVTLAKPTAPMRQEAVKAGYYESPVGASFPKIQILTVEGLLNGSQRPRYPDLTQGGLMSRKPKREIAEVQLSFDSVAIESVDAHEEIKDIARRKGARVARATQRTKSHSAKRKAG